MISAELYLKSLKGKRTIDNLIAWQDYNYGHELSNDEKLNIKALKYQKFKNKSIRITCDSNSYIKVPNFYKTYYTIVSDDNYTKEELSVLTKEPKEIFIPIRENEINFDKSSSLFRPYIIDVVSNNENIIKRYCLVVSINYKDNGLINNENFDFDYSVRINKVFEKNITYGLIDYAFYGYFIWLIINIIMKKNIIDLINNPTTIIVLITYFINIFVKTKYIGNTILNKILFLLRIKKRDYFTNRELKRMYKKIKK